MILSFLDTLQEWIEPFREFVYKHHNNPLLWLGFFGIGLALFFIGYSGLHKEN